MELTPEQKTELAAVIRDADNASTPFHPDIDYPTFMADRLTPLIEKWLSPAPCVMTRTEPFDFAQCETHDETFPLGEKCRFDGRDPIDVYADEAWEQRLRAVRAEQDRNTPPEGWTEWVQYRLKNTTLVRELTAGEFVNFIRLNPGVVHEAARIWRGPMEQL